MLNQSLSVSVQKLQFQTGHKDFSIACWSQELSAWSYIVKDISKSGIQLEISAWLEGTQRGSSSVKVIFPHFENLWFRNFTYQSNIHPDTAVQHQWFCFFCDDVRLDSHQYALNTETFLVLQEYRQLKNVYRCLHSEDVDFLIKYSFNLIFFSSHS